MAVKWYAVKVGMDGPAVYDSWAACKEKVEGVTGAKYKSFPDEAAAREYAFGSNEETVADVAEKRPVDVVAYTDGSFIDHRHSGFGFLLLDADDADKVIYAEYGPTTKDATMRNIGGEIEAAERAVAQAILLGFRHIEIHHDYEGVGAWGNLEWRRNREDTDAYADFVRDSRREIEISFVKVKGHSGEKYNELADRLAGMGANSDKIVVLDPTDM